MKKLIIIGIGVALVGALCCGFNRGFFDTKWEFRTAYINLGGDYGTICVKVEKWQDFENSDCVQVTTPDGTTYVSHYSHCTLCTSEKPLKKKEVAK